MVRDAEARSQTKERVKRHRNGHVTPMKQASSVSVSSSSSKHKNKSIARASPSPVGFDNFWNAYPKKIAKPKAIQAWKKLKIEEQILVLAGLESWKRAEQWNRDNGQFIPYPATFLNQRRWEDQPTGFLVKPKNPLDGAVGQNVKPEYLERLRQKT
jgi:hypothetical protein